MSTAPSDRTEPAEKRIGSEVPTFTRIASLWIWTALTLLAALLTPGYSPGVATTGLEFRMLYERFWMNANANPGASTTQEIFALAMPLLVATSAIALGFAWYFLYRYLKFYLLPVLFLDVRPPDRGPDVRTNMGVRNLRRAFFLLAVATLLRMAPGILVQVAPTMLRTAGGFGF